MRLAQADIQRALINVRLWGYSGHRNLSPDVRF